MDRVQPFAESEDQFGAIDYHNLVPSILKYEDLFMSQTFTEKMFISHK